MSPQASHLVAQRCLAKNSDYVNYAPNMLDDSTIPQLIITRLTTLLLPQKKIVVIGFGHAIRPQQLLATLEPSEGSASRSQARTALVDKPACAVGLTT